MALGYCVKKRMKSPGDNPDAGMFLCSRTAFDLDPSRALIVESTSRWVCSISSPNQRVSTLGRTLSARRLLRLSCLADTVLSIAVITSRCRRFPQLLAEISPRLQNDAWAGAKSCSRFLPLNGALASPSPAPKPVPFPAGAEFARNWLTVETS